MGAHVEHPGTGLGKGGAQRRYHRGAVVAVHGDSRIRKGRSFCQTCIPVRPAQGFKKSAVGQRPAARERPHGGFNRQAVVVEDQQNVRTCAAAVVQGFKRHSAGQGPVAHHRNALAAATGGCVGAPKTQRCGQCCGGVPRTKGVKRRFLSFGEAAQAARLSLRGKGAGAVRDDFVQVRLVPHVPKQDVLRGVQHVVQGHREFCCAQGRGQMACFFAGLGQRKTTNARARCRKFLHRQRAQRA